MKTIIIIIKIISQIISSLRKLINLRRRFGFTRYYQTPHVFGNVFYINGVFSGDNKLGTVQVIQGDIVSASFKYRFFSKLENNSHQTSIDLTEIKIYCYKK